MRRGSAAQTDGRGLSGPATETGVATISRVTSFAAAPAPPLAKRLRRAGFIKPAATSVLATSILGLGAA